MVDYGKGPSQAEWAEEDELNNTGISGWNYLQRLPVVLQRHIPWLKKFKMAFSSEDDVETFAASDWHPMRSEHFGTEGLKNFNKVVGYRFNLTDTDGVIRYRNQILMLMPKDRRERQMQRRHDHYEDYYKKVTNERAPYVHPLDPRGVELSDDSVSEREEGILQHDENMAPGQVRKEKKK